MPHVIERASSGRAKCRACGGKIASGDLRFGERQPNPFGDDGGEMTLWFHVPCGAFTRPEPFLEALEQTTEAIDDREHFAHQARLGLAHRRLPRAFATSRAPTGRATCRSCRKPIARDTWRISLIYFEDARFVPSGFIHAGCAGAYFETTEIVDRLGHFSPELTAADLEEVRTHWLDPGGKAG
ncbi:MAG TPA: hypothetical protein VLA20_09975 [Vicinamibacterales bacterium]|nr:hypothetical protein [Vicinamibacterales bacterium]